MISKLLEFMSLYLDSSINDTSLSYDLFSRAFWDNHQRQFSKSQKIEKELSVALDDNNRLKQLYNDIHSYKKKYNSTCEDYEKYYVQRKILEDKSGYSKPGKTSKEIKKKLLKA